MRWRGTLLFSQFLKQSKFISKSAKYNAFGYPIRTNIQQYDKSEQYQMRHVTRKPVLAVHAAKCYDQSRLITWNFESHVTFLRGFCVDITRKYREFCVERGDRTWNSTTLAWLPAWKRLTVSVKKIICRIILPMWMNIALRLECYRTAAFRKVLIFFWNAKCGEILSMKDRSFSVNHDLPCHNFECLHQLREVICIRL